MIAKKEPYVLFLDELNACSQEVQKAFYSLIHERRIGEYHLPEGSVVIGAGNRSQDGAIAKQFHKGQERSRMCWGQGAECQHLEDLPWNILFPWSLPR